MGDFQFSPYLVCIDIGTSYSGYTLKSKYVSGSSTFYTPSFHGGKLLSKKTPTAILLDSKKDLIAFGYEAIDRYSQAVVEEEQDAYFYINDVKPLYNEQFTPEALLKDVSGKTIDALEVISHAFMHLKLLCIKEIQDTREFSNVNSETDISYVLSVPSTNESITRYIIESMVKTGTRKTKICTVSDAVAAYVYYQNQKENESSANQSDVNKKILIVDAGGEITKFTVLAIQTESKVAQIATGIIPWGGQSVDRAFIGMLSTVFSQSVMDYLKNEELEDYIDLLREFESKKRNVRSDQENKIAITLPVSLTDLIKRKYRRPAIAIENSQYKDGMAYSKEKIHIEYYMFRDLFKESNDRIRQGVQSVLQHPKLTGIKTVLVVGGYAKSEILQAELRRTVGKSVKLIFPVEEEVVMKGGVLYGIEPINVVMTKNPIKLSLTDESKTHEQAQTSAQKCVSCERTAIYFCYDCTLIYCENCKKTHDKIPATKSHKVADLKKVDRSLSRPGARCNTHKDFINHACENCDVLICTKCVTTSHKSHSISDISSVVNKSRENLAASLAVLKSGLKTLEADVAEIRSVDIKTPAQKGKNEIQAIQQHIDDAVQRHASYRNNEIDDVYQMQEAELKYELNRKTIILNKQRALATSLERLQLEEHDVSFFTAYNVLKEEIIDVNYVIGNPLTSEIRPLDRRAFLETSINEIISSFGYSAVNVIDGKVVIKTSQTDKKGKR